MFLFTAIEKFSEINFHRKKAVFKIEKILYCFLILLSPQFIWGFSHLFVNEWTWKSVTYLKG